jgi:hypothetical protein
LPDPSSAGDPRTRSQSEQARWIEVADTAKPGIAQVEPGQPEGAHCCDLVWVLFGYALSLAAPQPGTRLYRLFLVEI